MKEKAWEVRFAGRVIRAVNAFSLFPPRSSERLELDGEVIAEKAGGVTRPFAVLRATVDIEGAERRIEARIATKQNGITTGCHLFIDGELVGGDTDRKLQIAEPAVAAAELARGPWRYVLRAGVPGYGLPYVVAMTFFQAPREMRSGVLTFAFHCVCFGSIMGWFSWRSLKAQAAILSANRRRDPGT